VIHIAVGIPYRNQSQIQAFVDSVSNPASPNYRHFITPDEVGRRFGIAASQVKQVQDYLSSMGMKIRRVAQNRLAILADATVSQAEAAFNTTLDEFEAPDSTMPKGEILFSFTRPPSVPTSIRRLVLSIEGLENFNKPHSEFTLTPSQLQTLYSAAPIYHSGYQGQGRTIGITCMTTYGLANIPLLYSYFNLPTPSGGVGSNVKVVHVNGSNGNVSSGAEGEGDADIQCTLMMAPLCNLIVYDGSAGKLYLDTLTVEADANACDIITESYNVDGSGLDSWRNMHLSMSAQGITNLCAAGDSGTAGVVKYPYPDADPEVLSVGGTTVAIDTAGNRTSEIVWDNPQSDGKGVGAGGWATIANSWNALPSWQVGNGVPTDIPYRLVPDVTLDADPNSGYEGFLDGAYRKVGGTSCGSPTMAGLLADCEQEIIAGGGLPPNADGYQRFGRLQDLIYSYNGDPSVFYDVVSGSNGTLPNNQTSVAGPGWDTASGWGAMIFSGFVNRVLGTVGVGNLAFSPPSVVGGTTSTGTIGLTAAAPPGGATVMLTSASSAVIVPASVSLPAGASSATFTATTTAIGASTPVIVTATLGSSSATGTLTILPPSLSGLTLSPASVVGGTKSTGTVTLTGPAPSTGISVGLSSNTNLATVPSSVNVLAGGT
jgi:subtilase family serine protease